MLLKTILILLYTIAAIAILPFPHLNARQLIPPNLPIACQPQCNWLNQVPPECENDTDTPGQPCPQVCAPGRTQQTVNCLMCAYNQGERSGLSNGYGIGDGDGEKPDPEVLFAQLQAQCGVPPPTDIFGTSTAIEIGTDTGVITGTGTSPTSSISASGGQTSTTSQPQQITSATPSSPVSSASATSTAPASSALATTATPSPAQSTSAGELSTHFKQVSSLVPAVGITLVGLISAFTLLV